MLENAIETRIAGESFFDAATLARRLSTIGRGVLRYGVVALLLLWGGMKFFDFEAQAIRKFVEHSPLLSWMYPAFGVRGASALIGIGEVAAAVAIAARPWLPRVSAYGSLAAAGTFVVTRASSMTASSSSSRA